MFEKLGGVHSSEIDCNNGNSRILLLKLSRKNLATDFPFWFSSFQFMKFVKKLRDGEYTIENNQARLFVSCFSISI